MLEYLLPWRPELKYNLITIEPPEYGHIKTIAWHGDVLVDWLVGYICRLDGFEPQWFNSMTGYRFD